MDGKDNAEYYSPLCRGQQANLPQEIHKTIIIMTLFMTYWPFEIFKGLWEQKSELVQDVLVVLHVHVYYKCYRDKTVY